MITSAATSTTRSTQITSRSRSHSLNESETISKQEQEQQQQHQDRDNEVYYNTTTNEKIPSSIRNNNSQGVFTRAFSHTGTFPSSKECRGDQNCDEENLNNNISAGSYRDNNSIFKPSTRDLSHQAHPDILIEDDEDEDFCGELEVNTANEIIQNLRNSIYDNVPTTTTNGTSSDSMLTKTLPNDVNLGFDESYFVTDLNIRVGQKMNSHARHASSEDDDDDESISSHEECEEIDEVESIRSLHHLDILGGLPELKKPGMGSVDSGVPSSPVMRSPR